MNFLYQYTKMTGRTTRTFWHIGHVWENFLMKFFFALKVWWFPRLWAFILHCSNFSVPNLKAIDTSILKGFLISIYQNHRDNNPVILAYWPCLRNFFNKILFGTQSLVISKTLCLHSIHFWFFRPHLGVCRKLSLKPIFDINLSK